MDQAVCDRTAIVLGACQFLFEYIQFSSEFADIISIDVAKEVNPCGFAGDVQAD